MRVLAISNLFPPGCVGEAAHGALDVCRGLHARGHEIRVLTADHPPDDSGGDSEFPVSRVLNSIAPLQLDLDPQGTSRRGVFVSPRNLRLTGTELIAFRPDAVMIFDGRGLGVLGLLRHLTGAGAAAVLFLMGNVFQGYPEAGSRREAARRLFGPEDFLDQVSWIAISARIRVAAEAALGRISSDVTIIPGWRDTTVDHAAMPPPTGNAGSLVRFVCTCEVSVHSGVDIVLDATWRLLRSGLRGFTVDMFGGGETAALQQTIAALGIGDAVRYLGAPPEHEKSRLMAGYDALLLPAPPGETFGFDAINAAAAGCIPIMTAGIGAAERFSGGQCLTIERDPNAFATAMREVVEMPAPAREAMRRNCRETALRDFGFDDVPARVEAVLRRAAGRTVEPAAVRGAEAALTLLDGMWRSTG